MQQIDRYIPIELLGAGGAGRVFRARDSVLGREVALKVLEDGEAPIPEARAMARVSHPNLVTVFDAGTSGDLGYIAMELVDGVRLERWCATQPSMSARRRVLRDVAHALVALHEAGLVHGDVSPRNVLVDAVGRARVLDLGLCHDAMEDPAALRGAGTPAYMAPEQVRRERPTLRSDVFSFCVLAFEVLFGPHPYGGHGARARRAMFRDEITAVNSLSESSRVRDAIVRGLRRDPERRPHDLQSILTALQPRTEARRAIALDRESGRGHRRRLRTGAGFRPATRSPPAP